MKISFELSALTTKRLMVLGTYAAGLLLAGVAYAVTTPFGENDTLTATALNGNFSSLQAEVDGLKADVAALKAANAKETQNGKYSSGAVFKGVAVPTKGSIVSGTKTGYAAAKERCQTAVTPASDSAHMCTGEELVRARQLGIVIPRGWYSTAAASFIPNYAPNIPQGTQFDCNGWSSTAANDWAPVWNTNIPQFGLCSVEEAILCCD